MSAVRLLGDEELTLIDLHGPGREVSADVLQAFNEFGFLVVRNHDIDLSLLSECFDLARTFFAFPDADKNQLNHSVVHQGRYGNIGYYPYKSETALGSGQPDLKEFFHIGPILRSDNPMLITNYGANVWPAKLSDFGQKFTTLYRQFAQCGDKLMRIITQAYGLESVYVDDLIIDGNSIVRLLHYPPAAETDNSAMRAAPHTGINLLGLQPPSTHAGLQFCTPDDEWVAPRTMSSDCLTINAGEMLSYLLGGRIAPTLHRVVNSQDGSELHHRYTIVFFYHANPTRYLRSNTGTTVLVGDWLMERLREIGMKEN